MQAAERAAQASMNELVGEIRNSIQYFASLPGRLPVSRVLVTGGGSELARSPVHARGPGPPAGCSPFHRSPGSTPRSWTSARSRPHEVGPVLATPIGLALPEPDKAVKKFNLLPPEVAKRARMKTIQERTLLVRGRRARRSWSLFGAWKFYQVHNAQNNVNALQANIATLNAQVPKYDLVVAANNAYSAGVARRASVLNSAVDWPLALSNLISITPANAAGAVVRRHAATATDRGGEPPATATATTAASSTAASGASSHHVGGHRNHPDSASPVRGRACPSPRRGSTPSPDRRSSPTRSRGRPR